MFKIEKNIPIPTRYKYPFKEMKIGDSFLVEVDMKDKLKIFKMRANLYGACRRAMYEDEKFVIRKEDDKGLRVWRTK